MKNRKALLNSLFLVLSIGITLCFLFRGQDLGTLLSYMGKASPVWWMAGVMLVVLFIMSESVVMHYLLNTLGSRTRLPRCFLYSFTGFFFCLVTPGASGGQPVQLLFMKKDGIPVHISTLVLLIITIAYKSVLILFSAFVFMFRPARIMSLIAPVMFWIVLGLMLTSVSIGTMLMLIWKPGIVMKVSMGIFSMIGKIVKSEKVDSFEDRLRESVTKYGEVAGFLRSHRGLSVKVVAMTTVQRCLLFLVTVTVLLSFGINGLGVFETVTLQAMISTAVDMLPVPGGMGMSEHLYSKVFLPVCGEALTLPSLLIVRGLTYYTQLLISAVMMSVAYIKVFGRTDREEKLAA